MSDVQTIKRNLDSAKEYVAKVGRAESHFKPVSYGKVSSLEVKSCINHQENTGSTNYWNDNNFDKALAEVVRSNFKELAQQALAAMEAQYNAARIAEKSVLQQKLAEIEALEAS